jgi:hypothetical protein
MSNDPESDAPWSIIASGYPQIDPVTRTITFRRSKSKSHSNGGKKRRAEEEPDPDIQPKKKKSKPRPPLTQAQKDQKKKREAERKAEKEAAAAAKKGVAATIKEENKAAIPITPAATVPVPVKDTNLLPPDFIATVSEQKASSEPLPLHEDASDDDGGGDHTSLPTLAPIDDKSHSESSDSSSIIDAAPPDLWANIRKPPVPPKGNR